MSGERRIWAPAPPPTHLADLGGLAAATLVCWCDLLVHFFCWAVAAIAAGVHPGIDACAAKASATATVKRAKCGNMIMTP